MLVFWQHVLNWKYIWTVFDLYFFFEWTLFLSCFSNRIRNVYINRYAAVRLNRIEALQLQTRYLDLVLAQHLLKGLESCTVDWKILTKTKWRPTLGCHIRLKSNLSHILCILLILFRPIAGQFQANTAHFRHIRPTFFRCSDRCRSI